jgi:hypothetical protein
MLLLPWLLLLLALGHPGEGGVLLVEEVTRGV